MTIANRTTTITGVFAKNALTTIPPTPVSGTSYRDTGITQTEAETGFPYKEIVDSAAFNQMMYEYSALTKLIETYGFLPWSNLTDYEEGSICLGSDGVIYQAKQATGPSSTAYDPVNDTSKTYWEDFVGSNYVTLSTTQNIPGPKTFGSNITIYKKNARVLCDDSSATWQTDPVSSTISNGLEFRDSAHYWGALIGIAKYTNGLRNLKFSLRGKSSDTSHDFDFFVNSAGAAYCNADAGYKSSIVAWGMPNYAAGIEVSNNTEYTCPSNGYIMFSGLCNLSVNSTVTINGSVVMTYNYNSGHHNLISGCFPVSTGDKVTVNITYKNNGITFYPAKGG